ncbi:MAG: hypothetical protein OXG91_00600, partial [bacterium]|nr:hypothetical protein [bacterium]
MEIVTIGRRHARERTVLPEQGRADVVTFPAAGATMAGVRRGESGNDSAGGVFDGVADRVDESAKRAGGNLKWGIDPPGVLPAWIAEHD